MKINRQYTLYINRMEGSAFNTRISRATFGEIYDCTLSQLKSNIHMLAKQGITSYCRKY